MPLGLREAIDEVPQLSMCTGYRAWGFGLGFGVSVLGFRVWGLGFRVRVWGFRFGRNG